MRWGHRFLRYEESERAREEAEHEEAEYSDVDSVSAAALHGRSVRAFFENSAKEHVSEKFSLLVAADGIYSAVTQQLIPPHTHPVPSSPLAAPELPAAPAMGGAEGGGEGGKGGEGEGGTGGEACVGVEGKEGEVYI